MARSEQELRGNENPKSDEDPFYCLLEDDQLVSRLNVDTDRLLEINNDGKNKDRWVKLVIQAKIRPIETTQFNLSFA